MKNNLIADKTFDFALNIIDLYINLKKKMNLFYRNNCLGTEQV